MVDLFTGKTGPDGPLALGGGAPLTPKVHRPDPDVDGPSFGDVLKNSLMEVIDLQTTAGKKTQDLVTGDIQDIHEVMIAVEEAGIAFNMTMQVRNQIIKAFDELMRMQI